MSSLLFAADVIVSATVGVAAAVLVTGWVDGIRSWLIVAAGVFAAAAVPSASGVLVARGKVVAAGVLATGWVD
jgi:hypothetical protein